MKIAMVAPVMIPVPPPKYGGIQLIVDELARGLAQRGHQITIFCSGGSTIEGKNITCIESSPYPLEQHPEENRLWEEHQLKTVIERQNEFDLIHLHYEPAVCQFNVDGKNINLADYFSVPLAFTFHNSTSIAKHINYYRNNPSLYKHTYIFISKNQLQPLSFFPKAQVIYNALPIEKFSFELEKENYLLFLGRITPSKGILEAIAVTKKTQIPLVIIAKVDHADRDFYENEVKPKIDGHLIRYLGEANFLGKQEYLKRAQCLLFPILWEEPFGLVMAESLACGTPVVAFRRGSVPEIIQDGVNGFIVDNIDQMVDAVKKIKMISSAKCRESVEGRFSIDRMVDQYESLFEKVIQENQK